MPLDSSVASSCLHAAQLQESGSCPFGPLLPSSPQIFNLDDIQFAIPLTAILEVQIGEGNMMFF